MSENHANRQIARATGVVMLGFVLSQVTGLARQNLVSRTFGTSAELDAFYAAAIIPDLLFMLVSGGALASAFIPTFTHVLETGDRARTWRLASAVLNLVVLILAALSLISGFLAPQLVKHVLYAFRPDLDPALQELTASLLRVVLVAPAIYAISGLLMGILNTHQNFWLPALAPTFNWLGWIIGVVVFAPRMGIIGLAWGYVLGALMHLVVQLPGLRRLPGLKYQLTLGKHIPEVREIARLMAPRLLGVAIVQLNFVINTILATAQPEGSLTAIKVAWMVVTVPQVVIAQAIAIAALPTFSAQAARGATEELGRSLTATLRGVILLSVPASIGLILLRTPVVALLFQYGKFDAHSTELVSAALFWYAAGLLGHSLVEILSRAFYALHDTKTPVLIGAAAMGLNILFSFGFSALFSKFGFMPHAGLALANSLATALEAAGLLYLINRRLPGVQNAGTLSALSQSILAAFGMGVGLAGWLALVPNQPVWLQALGGVALGGLVYGLLALALRVTEIHQALQWALRHISVSINN